MPKLYSFDEQITDEFLDKIDVDSNIYYNVFDFFQSPHRIATKGCNKKFWSQFVPILQSKDKAALYPPRRTQKFQKWFWFYRKQFAGFFKALESVYRFHNQNLKFRLDLPKQKKCLLIFVKIWLNVQTGKFIYCSDMETTNPACFPSKELSCIVISS